MLTTVLFFRDLGSSTANENVFAGLVSLWLWFTVLFANFAEAMAEGRGKAQAATLRTDPRRDHGQRPPARRLPDREGLHRSCRSATCASSPPARSSPATATWSRASPPSTSPPSRASRRRSSARAAAIAPRSPAGRGSSPTRSSCDHVQAGRDLPRPHDRPRRGSEPAEDAERDRPHDPAGRPHDHLPARRSSPSSRSPSTRSAEQSIIVLVALLVCLIPTTIGALLSAIGIAGMDRLVQRNVLAMSGRAVEAAGDVNTLLLDKTGTITFGSRQAAELVPVLGVDERDLAEVAMLSSLADETPEGRSIVAFAVERYGLVVPEAPEAVLVPFTAQTRMSGMDFVGGRSVRKGAADSVRTLVLEEGGAVPIELAPIVDGISRDGATPLAVFDRQRTDPPRILGVIRLKDTVKPGMNERFDELRAMGIRTVMVTGDNPLTAAAIAEGGRRRRLPGRGDARGQDGADPARAGGRPPHRHDRRRHQRRSRARSGRRRRGHEHRHAGGEGSREHGRPRLEPDQAHRDRRDRQAAPHHPWLAHDVLHRQRRRQVLRHHPGHVRGRPAGARLPQHHAPADARARRSSRPSSSTP